MIRAAINGYGRIGRLAHRIALLSNNKNQKIEIVAINASRSTDLQGWMYLLKYDTTYGVLDESIKLGFKQENNQDYLIINEKSVVISYERDPQLLPWKDLSIDVVLECTGAFLTPELLQKHINAGAKAVILSAPFKSNNNKCASTAVLGVNEIGNNNNIISNASCTTNCIAPIAQIMEDNFGIEKAMMTTIHGYTSDQNLHDAGHKDYRRARAATENIVPTSTGATKAVGEIIPNLASNFNGIAFRVPVITGSLADITLVLKRNTSIEEVNKVLKESGEMDKYKGIVSTTTAPLVSSDIIGNSSSCVIDLNLTQVLGNNLCKVVAWYDNEYGYASRLLEQAIILGNQHTVNM